ncbi:MAG: hypothetical protein WBE31_13845, partial [Candidatus Sulfotelmatobacter sp.]
TQIFEAMKAFVKPSCPHTPVTLNPQFHGDPKPIDVFHGSRALVVGGDGGPSQVGLAGRMGVTGALKGQQLRHTTAFFILKTGNYIMKNGNNTMKNVLCSIPVLVTCLAPLAAAPEQKVASPGYDEKGQHIRPANRRECDLSYLLDTA